MIITSTAFSQIEETGQGWGYIIDSITSLKSERTQTEKREPMNQYYQMNSLIQQRISVYYFIWTTRKLKTGKEVTTDW